MMQQNKKFGRQFEWLETQIAAYTKGATLAQDLIKECGVKRVIYIQTKLRQTTENSFGTTLHECDEIKRSISRASLPQTNLRKVQRAASRSSRSYERGNANQISNNDRPNGIRAIQLHRYGPRRSPYLQSSVDHLKISNNVRPSVSYSDAHTSQRRLPSPDWVYRPLWGNS
jgi:hypothetical protein